MNGNLVFQLEPIAENFVERIMVHGFGVHGTDGNIELPFSATLGQWSELQPRGQ